MQDFSGGPNYKNFGIFVIHAAKRHVANSQVANRTVGSLYQICFLNGAILCVLRAIFNHFHDKKSSQKTINKQIFFH